MLRGLSVTPLRDQHLEPVPAGFDGVTIPQGGSLREALVAVFESTDGLVGVRDESGEVVGVIWADNLRRAVQKEREALAAAPDPDVGTYADLLSAGTTAPNRSALDPDSAQDVPRRTRLPAALDLRPLGGGADLGAVLTGVFAGLTGAAVVFLHRANLSRLRAGTESRFRGLRRATPV